MTPRFAASAAEWNHFDLMLGRGPDLLPVVSNPRAQISPQSSMSALGKTPSQYNTARQVVGIRDWTNKQASSAELEAWPREPDYGICIQTRTLRALDVDVEDPVLAAAVSQFIQERITLPARMRENSSKFLLAFELPGEYYKRKMQLPHGIIEFLATGQQFVACGTHPSGARYEWQGGLPDLFPVLSAAEFEKLWRELESAFAIEPSTTSSASTKGVVLTNAIANDPVAQHLVDSHRVKATDRTGMLHITCPFEEEHSEGPGSESSTSYWPANTGGYAKGHFKCLHAHCEGRTDAEFLEAIDYEMPAANDEFLDLTAEPAAIVDLVDDTPVESEPAACPEPFRGVMADAVAAALQVAPKPQPEMATMAALIGMAAAVSGIYRLPSGMRCNLYGCNIAGTGEGKDSPRRVAVEISRAGGGIIQGMPASGQGLEDALESQTPTLLEIDEIAHLFAAMNGTRVPPHLVELARVLLQQFSASSGAYNTRTKVATSSSKPRRRIVNPMVNILGSATPEKLGEALGASNVEDGLLGRFLFVRGRSNVAPRRISNSFRLSTAAKDHGQRLQNVAALKLASGEGTASKYDVTITTDPATELALDDLMQRAEKRRRQSRSPFARALFARSAEKAERVAGVLAAWDDPDAPVMTVEHVDWAGRFVSASDAAVLLFTEDFMHGGEVQADARRIRSMIERTLSGEYLAQRANEAGFISQKLVPWSTALRGSKLSASRFAAAVGHLKDLEEVRVEFGMVKSGNGGSHRVRLLRL